MAVPTITGVSPARGPALGRNLIVITGTNFRDSADPPFAAPTTTAPPKPVRVTVDGEVAPRVEVAATTELHVWMPAFRGDVNGAVEGPAYPAVAIKVENLDSAGVLIPGESVTLQDAYIYERFALRAPEQTTDSPGLRVSKELVRLFQRGVLRNVSLAKHTEYTDTPFTQLDVVALPSIHLVGPRVAYDPEFSHQEYELETLAPNVVEVFDPPTIVMMEYDVVGVSDNQSEFQSMMVGTREAVERAAYLDVDRGGGKGRIDLALQVTEEPSSISTPSDSNLRVFSMTLRVRGVPIRFSEPRDRAYRVDTVQQQAGGLTGAGIETFELA